MKINILSVFQIWDFIFKEGKNIFQIRFFELDYLYQLNCPFHGRVSMEGGEREKGLIKNGISF
jgi:hypothetical protein